MVVLQGNEKKSTLQCMVNSARKICCAGLMISFGFSVNQKAEFEVQYASVCNSKQCSTTKQLLLHFGTAAEKHNWADYGGGVVRSASAAPWRQYLSTYREPLVARASRHKSWSYPLLHDENRRESLAACGHVDFSHLASAHHRPFLHFRGARVAMTSVRDFQVPSRASTMPLGKSQSRERGEKSDNPQHHRRGSVTSRLSGLSEEHSMRQRRLPRSNTVTTYHAPEHPNWQPGAEPGIDTALASEKVSPHLEALQAACEINIVDFSDVEVDITRANNEDLAEKLEQPRPTSMPCRWISVNGLSWDVIKMLGNKYGLHRLAIEDLISTHSRTKVDWYSDHAFVILTLQKLVRLHQHHESEECDCPAEGDMDDEKRVPARSSTGLWSRSKRSNDNVLPRYEVNGSAGKMDKLVNAHSTTSAESPIQPIRTLHRYESYQIPEYTAFMEKHSALAEEDLVVSVEQVSIFLTADNTVISFFEHSAPDVERPILERLSSEETMLRSSCDASLLLQAIIDAIVDLAQPVKDAYNKARKELQVDVLTMPSIKTSRSLHIFGEEIDMLQNLFKPIVHLVNALRDHTNDSSGVAGAYSTGIPQQQTHRPGDPPSLSRNSSDYGARKSFKRGPVMTSVTITPLAHTYLGDVLDHCITTIQALVSHPWKLFNIVCLILIIQGTNGRVCSEFVNAHFQHRRRTDKQLYDDSCRRHSLLRSAHVHQWLFWYEFCKWKRPGSSVFILLDYCHTQPCCFYGFGYGKYDVGQYQGIFGKEGNSGEQEETSPFKDVLRSVCGTYFR
jgi:Mg2+ and Co2+ transporter CorA